MAIQSSKTCSLGGTCGKVSRIAEAAQLRNPNENLRHGLFQTAAAEVAGRERRTCGGVPNGAGLGGGFEPTSDPAWR